MIVSSSSDLTDLSTGDPREASIPRTVLSSCSMLMSPVGDCRNCAAAGGEGGAGASVALCCAPSSGVGIHEPVLPGSGGHLGDIRVSMEDSELRSEGPSLGVGMRGVD